MYRGGDKLSQYDFQQNHYPKKGKKFYAKKAQSLCNLLLREAAKKWQKEVFFFFSLEKVGNEFWQRKILHNSFELKESYFCHILTNLYKNFAYSVHLSIDMSSY